MVPFTHLHVHSQYSILDGAASVAGLVKKAADDGMTALALTDHGTMFGIKEFHANCAKNNIKPILGCETYVARRGRTLKKEKVDRSGYHLIMLAKNEIGYKNLLKLISEANTSGMYYRPRIDRELLEKYNEGLIITSACLGGEVPQHIMKNDMAAAEETVQWYKNIFGEDFYLEMQRHPNKDPRLETEIWENQQKCNAAILELSKKFGVKTVAANDVHFINKEDAAAHDLLICLNTGKDYDDENRMRYTKQEWFKTTEEMQQLFSDVPESIATTAEIADKVEFYELNHAPIMPEFPIPEDFGNMEDYRSRFTDEDLKKEFTPDGFDRLGGYESVLRVKLEADYLDHIVYIGAKDRYGDDFSGDNKERIDFELMTIRTMGFPGYFLIVQDFIAAARDMGVIVGPGRGSAAGSAVAYSIGITNVDPIKYDLLFERFLNPDRVSMPDIDIDFDDDGRQQVLDWVTEKYGQDKVAHICTFGTMAAKSAIRDVARVLKLPLPEALRLAKMVPEAPKMTIAKAFKENPELEQEQESEDELIRDTLKYAKTLEGSVRQTGVHACGVLIGKHPLDNNIPVMPTKGEELLTTQFDGRYVEDIGLLKMDFLGLKTLSIIKETLGNIKLSKGIDIDIDAIPMTDEATYKLFSRGDTTAIFQFESPGMKKYLRMLQPNRFDDLVAMNALYRPGPMEYIPEFIDRKHGRSEIIYDNALMEPYLNSTYGITVFQEQVMLQSRALGGFTRGQSDELRKAMGKKKHDLMAQLKIKFVAGCHDNKEFVENANKANKNVDQLIEKIWGDWAAFASYAFNKSHSVCYAYIAYQTGYLKAHYPAEFMAAVLSRNLTNMDKISIFMDEVKHMGLDVKGPDINESFNKFTVNKEGVIRFGMAGIKGVGSGAVDEIIREREENGPFKDIYDVVERVHLQSVNKKNMEGLIISGAFDGFENIYRSQFFADNKDKMPFLESLIRYGHMLQEDKKNSMASLFGDSLAIEIKKPDIPKVPEWPKMMRLEKEKELIGIYLSSHPLDDFRLEIDNFCTKGVNLAQLNSQLADLEGQELTFAGMVDEARQATTKTGKPFSDLTLTDYSDSYRFFFFGKDHENFGKFAKQGLFLMIKGKVQKSSFRQGELEFRVTFVELIQEVRSRVKNVQLEIDSKIINKILIDELYEVVNEHKGNTSIKFLLKDEENDLSVNLLSKDKRVSLSNDFIDYLQNKSEIVFKIN